MMIMLPSEEVTPILIVESDSILFKSEPSPTNILTLTNWKIKIVVLYIFLL
jgi:hypothetical protein